MADVLIARVSYDVLITRVLITRVDCMLGIGRTYFENIRNHLINNGSISRLHGNIKRMPQ